MADHRDHPADETATTDPVHRDETVSTEDRRDVVGREREEHGGIKMGACFFGWLSATGMAVLLSAVVAATGLLASDATDTDTAGEAARDLGIRVDDLGVVGVVVALAIWFVSYYAGGYVAGRMARFDGLRQGIGVWLWAVLAAIVVGVLGAVFGSDYQPADGFPSVSFDEAGTMVVVIAAVVLLVVTLVGAMLGGLAGMRFHRKVDRTGLGR